MAGGIVGLDGRSPRLPVSQSDDEVRDMLRSLKKEFGVSILQDAYNETVRMPGILLASLMPELKKGFKGLREISTLAQPNAKLLKEIIEEK